MVYKFLNKNTGCWVSVNEKHAEELHKRVTKEFKRRKLYASFKDNIWAADIAEIKSLPSKYKNVTWLLCFMDVFTIYTWFKPLEDKKGKTVLNDFIKIWNESNHKTNKLWVDQGR